MNDRKKVERGIWLTPTQRYMVRVQDRSGSNAMATTTVDDLPHARALVLEADRIRSAGGSVKEHWGATSTTDARRAPRTVGEAGRAYLERRGRMAEDSNLRDEAEEHLTKDTVELQATAFRKHIEPFFGKVLSRDVDTALVQDFVQYLHDGGYAVDTQKRYLGALRAILEDVPMPARPEDLDWRKVKAKSPIRPRKRKNEPGKWGGRRRSKPPALPLAAVLDIAANMFACTRVVIYLMTFMGLRRGEVMGLNNSSYFCHEDRLWVAIDQQRSLKTGELKLRVKSRSSNRRLPVPRMLAAYIEMYWDRYHDGYRPELGTEHSRHEHQFTVTSTGRGTDGSFMGAAPGLVVNQLRSALKATGRTHDALGYTLRPHILRKIFVSYVKKAANLARKHAERLLTETAPEIDSGHPDLVAWALSMVEVIREALRTKISGADISAWCGHKNRRSKSDPEAGSQTTDRHYVLDLDDEAEIFIPIADFVDRLLSDLVDTLVHEPDERDTFLVIDPSDPAWVALPEASLITGKPVATLTSGIRRGTYKGVLCWYADGDSKPPGPRYMLERGEVAKIAVRQGSMSRSAAANRLGMSLNYVDAAIARDDIMVIERSPSIVFVDTSSVERLRARILSLVADLFSPSRGTTVDEAYAEFRSVPSAHEPSPYDRARQLRIEGATFEAAATACGISPDSLRSRARREQWKAPSSVCTHRDPIRSLFARPDRVSRALFDRWVREAAEAGALQRVNTTMLRRTDRGVDAA